MAPITINGSITFRSGYSSKHAFQLKIEYFVPFNFVFLQLSSGTYFIDNPRTVSTIPEKIKLMNKRSGLEIKV